MIPDGWVPWEWDGRVFWSPPPKPGTVASMAVEAEGIEHPAVVNYFDHLYAQELGIAYP